MRLIVTNVPWSACLSIEITFGIWTYAAQGPVCYMGSRSPAGKGMLGSLRSIEKNIYRRLVTRLPATSVTFLSQFASGTENFSFLVLLAYTAH